MPSAIFLGWHRARAREREREREGGLGERGCGTKQELRRGIKEFGKRRVENVKTRIEQELENGFKKSSKGVDNVKRGVQ